MKQTKEYYDAYLSEQMEELWEIARYIHRNPELNYEEEKACAAQCTYLRTKGFQVTQGIEELATAYVAVYGQGKPVIAVVSEYDALPEIGHGCGHNLICTCAMGTAMEVKRFLEEEQLPGTLMVIGTPAEEGGGGKIKLLEKGMFDEVDAVLMMHPTSGLTRLAGECMSSISLEIDFTGKSAHAGSHPEDGINALSAANLYFTATGLLRQHFKGDIRLSGIITEGGTAPGMIPEHTHVTGRISSFHLTELKKVSDQVVACAKGCAMALGCEASITVKEGYQGRVPNTILSELCRKEFISIDEPLMEGMPFDYGGEDLGNVSRRIPICNPYVTIFSDHKISNHTEQFRDLADTQAGYRCIQVGSNAMARTMMELYQQPDILQAAKKELAARLKAES